MRTRILRFDLDSIGTLTAPSSSNNVDLRKLAALGAKKKEGQILKVARLIMSIPTELDTTAATVSGIIPGRRVYEMLSRVQVAPMGWPVDYSHDCSGKTLRRHACMLHGHLHNIDPLDFVDEDASDVARRIVVPIEFWRERAPRPEDFCPAALHVGEGSMQFDLSELQISGVDNEQFKSPIRVIAECFYGDMEVPVFTRLRERSLGTDPQRFQLNVACDRLMAAWLHVHWSQASGTDHLEGSFNEDRTIQLELDGQRWIEDITIEELADAWNREVLSDSEEEDSPVVGYENTGCAQDTSVPTFLPLLCNYGRSELNTKMPRATNESYFEASGQLTDTATGTGRSLDLITDEAYEPKKGHKSVEEYLRVGRADGPVAVKRKTFSKKGEVAAHKASAMPLKITPLSKGSK